MPALAADWRAGFFRAILASFEAGEQSPNIDIVHANVLDEILALRGVGTDVWDAQVRAQLVKAWHAQRGPYSRSLSSWQRNELPFLD